MSETDMPMDARATGGVRRALGNVHDEISHLDEALSQLRTMLMPILGPESVEAIPSEAVPGFGSDLADEVQTSANRIHNLTAIIRETVERLDL